MTSQEEVTSSWAFIFSGVGGHRTTCTRTLGPASGDPGRHGRPPWVSRGRPQR